MSRIYTRRNPAWPLLVEFAKLVLLWFALFSMIITASIAVSPVVEDRLHIERPSK